MMIMMIAAISMIKMMIMVATMMASSKYVISTGCIDHSANDNCGDDDEDDNKDDDILKVYDERQG